MRVKSLSFLLALFSSMSLLVAVDQAELQRQENKRRDLQDEQRNRDIQQQEIQRQQLNWERQHKENRTEDINSQEQSSQAQRTESQGQ
jgi:hypothetical protein